MYMKGKMVHPDKRKGQVYIYQSEDSLMHFCWKDRTNGNVEDVRLHCHWGGVGGGVLQCKTYTVTLMFSGLGLTA